MFAEYFRAETRTLGERALTEVRTLEDWNKYKVTARQQLFEMLGLDPLPPKTDLHATVTGRLDHPEFTVEKLHFQSRPGLYVTGNVYVPVNLTAPAPAVLYVCGHAVVKTNGVSYGNKAGYQHWGAWFARNGYVCLIIDTVQLGEIEGIHHGTFKEGMWWWNSRGYTSAGAEAWNCIRALDYLQSRKDVDGSRIGVTGRSGGGAYSWWIAALDDRIKVACPTAGITDLQNYVVDGCVEGHCDCMFMVNTFRWDYAQVAALMAPRPLLIVNTDKDTIFPLDGVVRVHERVRGIYDLHNKPDQLGLILTEGPHKDTQELQVPVMRWFNKWLKQNEAPVPNYAEKLFTPQQLKVFEKLPGDEITSKCYENFTQLAVESAAFEPQKALAQLQAKTFGGWPATGAAVPVNVREVATTTTDNVRLSVHEFDSENGIRLRFYLARPSLIAPKELHIETVDESNWRQQLLLAKAGFAGAFGQELVRAGIDPQSPVTPEQQKQFAGWMRYIRDHGAAYITFAPRGVGPTALGGDKRYQSQVRRRFMLLGETLASTQVWDVHRASEVARGLPGLGELPLHFHASPEMTEVATFAALFEPKLASLTLAQPPRSDKDAPDFLNWSRFVTPGQLLQLAQQKTRVNLPKPR
ncbi:MAG: acetylxylan esterase [Proteobacteria bacterium]|nr:acetylxylan esterase [Pseudomonadota bacterium]